MFCSAIESGLVTTAYVEGIVRRIYKSSPSDFENTSFTLGLR